MRIRIRNSGLKIFYWVFIGLLLCGKGNIFREIPNTSYRYKNNVIVWRFKSHQVIYGWESLLKDVYTYNSVMNLQRWQVYKLALAQ